MYKNKNVQLSATIKNNFYKYYVNDNLFVDYYRRHLCKNLKNALNGFVRLFFTFFQLSFYIFVIISKSFPIYGYCHSCFIFNPLFKSLNMFIMQIEMDAHLIMFLVLLNDKSKMCMCILY